MSGAEATESAVPQPGRYRLVWAEDAPVTAATDEPRAEVAWTEPLLRQNARWFCRLRWLVVGVLGGAGVAVLLVPRFAALGVFRSPGLPLAAAAVLATLNLGFGQWIRRLDVREEGGSVRPLLWAQIVSDLLVLTVVIHGLGSGSGLAPFMYLFHIILACIAFTPGESLGVLGLAACCHVMRLVLEARGTWTVGGAPGAVALQGGGAEVGATPVVALTSMLLIWVVIWYLVSRLASTVRARDRALFVANGRLQASIEERSKHMLQTTHQLKAPFAAIHAQVQLLLEGYCGVLPAAATAVVEKISLRCRVLSRQVQEMLQLANLRSHGQTAPPARELALDHLIADVIQRVEPAAQQRGIGFDRQLEPVRLRGIEDHLTMLVDNLVVNAVTYSHDRGVVGVACRRESPGGAVLVVQDRGIGIPAEKLPHIFDDYYRTEEAVQHNRGSTGLGLAIVRQVACEDHLGIEVESAPGWGTRFTVTIPDAPTLAPARSPRRSC
ncbi:MAG: HAMP domain-containing histidine kinase [Verrucomicrobiales bacterium]|nr:HAMP domain-containing histidine kinase [Verrucomicrobiales bacterium]